VKIIQAQKVDGTLVDIDVADLRWRPAVHGIVLNEDGHLLVLDNEWTGKLDLPGGGVELHETLPEALVREVWEETGLRVAIGELVDLESVFFLSPHGNTYHSLKIFYRVTVMGGDLRSTIIENEPSVNPHWVAPTTLTENSFQVGWKAVQKAVL
jgi:8-oxo-dGTP pyrophosphatase MutT (NUDIX family)